MHFSGFLETLQIELPDLLEIPKIVIFLFSIFVALMVGRYTPSLVRLSVNRLSKQDSSAIYEESIHPVHGALKVAGTFALVTLSLAWTLI